MNHLQLMLRYPSKIIILARLGATLKHQLLIGVFQIWFTVSYRLGRSPSFRKLKNIEIRAFESVGPHHS
jgi:hypothetical protein